MFQILNSEYEDIKLKRNTVNFVPDSTYQKRLFSKYLVFQKITSVSRGETFVLFYYFEVQWLLKASSSLTFRTSDSFQQSFVVHKIFKINKDFFLNNFLFGNYKGTVLHFLLHRT